MPARERNVVIDTLRVASVVVVVLFHLVLFRAAWTSDGGVRATVAPVGFAGAVASWFVQVMPLFFVAAGFGHAVIAERLAGRGWVEFVAVRLARISGPLATFVLVIGGTATVVAWAGWPGEAIFLTRQLAKVLWFLTVFVIVVMLAPLQVRLARRAGGLTLLGLTIGALTVDVLNGVWTGSGPPAWIGLSADHLQHVNLFFVWVACAQVGILYHRGWWRTWPAAANVLVVLVAAATIIVLVGPGDYPLPAVGFGDRPVSNLLPPTIAMLVLCGGQVALVALLDRRRWSILRTPRVGRALATLSALLMTIYLWHVPAASVGMGVWLLITRNRPIDSWLLSALVTLGVALPLLVLLVPRIARLDLILVPRVGSRPHRAGVLTSAVLLLIGLALVWRHGLVAHPGSPGAAAGLIALGSGYAVLRGSAGDRSTTP